MTTQYYAVLTIWNDFPEGFSDLDTALYNKAKEMTLAGKMAKGTFRQRFPSIDHIPAGWQISDTYNPTPHLPGAFEQERTPYAPVVSNRTLRRDNDTQIVYISLPDVEYKGVRVFKTEADAEEWMAFTYSLGAAQSRIMTEQDIANLGLTWPDDSIIATYFV
jgi:hypothetical protein